MAIGIEPRPAVPAAPVARITATEFLKHPTADGPSELVHGEVLYLSPAGGRHGRIARNVAFALNAFVEPRGVGEVFTEGTGFALPPFDDVVRSPDTAYVQAGRLPAEDLPAGWVPIAPDLVVEVLSPDETHSMVMEKLDDYFAGGTTLAWVVDPRRRGVEVHAAGQPVRWVAYEGTLDGAPVLPEFAMPVAAVFAGTRATR